jgi:O-antigen/teichoic acid export membrane protein
MTAGRPKKTIRLLNAALRMTSLVAKLGLTLYMGRYLSLADLGVYGLVAGTVVILMDMLGVRLDYVVSHELVGAEPANALSKMRDQAVFYGLNYLVLAVIMAALVMVGAFGVGTKIMCAIFVLSVLESCANMTYLNIIAMGKPLAANILFFIRSGLWVLPVVALGLLTPLVRTSNAVFVFWALGGGASLAATLWVWRFLPWHNALRTPVDWKWIKKNVRRCFFIWLGTVGNTAGFYVGRFVVAHNLGLDLAGVATFYSSFTAALYALVQSGIFAFSYPRLIALHKKKDTKGFRTEAKSIAWHAAILAGIVAIVLGVVVPYLGEFFRRPLLVDQAPTFWLMLFGMWIGVSGGTLYYILFARHQDFAIWCGDLLYLTTSIAGNAILVPLIGFKGVGYSTIIWSVFLVLWRGWHVRYGKKT